MDLQNDELVHDLGCGLGYSTAVIARIAEMVIGVETEKMARDAQETLMEAGSDNAVVHLASLTEGAAENGHYDVIIIEGGVEVVPASITDQLKDGGRIAALFVTGTLGEVKIGYKSGGEISWRFAFNAGASVLPGFLKVKEFAL